MTTRAPRPGERDGVDYRFVTDAAFDALVASGALLEHAEVHGARYGTPRDQVELAIANGKTVVLEIDYQGARQVRAALPEALTVFIEPPSVEVMEQRLRARRTDSDQAIEQRLANAREELAAAGEFDHRVVNDVLEDAVTLVGRILDGTPSEKE